MNGVPRVSQPLCKPGNKRRGILKDRFGTRRMKGSSTFFQAIMNTFSVAFKLHNIRPVWIIKKHEGINGRRLGVLLSLTTSPSFLVVSYVVQYIKPFVLLVVYGL
jgi:hypothetical protein